MSTATLPPSGVNRNEINQIARAAGCFPYSRNDQHVQDVISALTQAWESSASGRTIDEADSLENIIDSFGFTFWFKPRGKQGKKGQRGHDDYIYGHKSKKRYRSTKEFIPHFLFLMESKASTATTVNPCDCILCGDAMNNNPSQAALPTISLGAPVLGLPTASGATNAQHQTNHAPSMGLHTIDHPQTHRRLEANNTGTIANSVNTDQIRQFSSARQQPQQGTARMDEHFDLLDVVKDLFDTHPPTNNQQGDQGANQQSDSLNGNNQQQPSASNANLMSGGLGMNQMPGNFNTRPQSGIFSNEHGSSVSTPYQMSGDLSMNQMPGNFNTRPQLGIFSNAQGSSVSTPYQMSGGLGMNQMPNTVNTDPEPGVFSAGQGSVAFTPNPRPYDTNVQRFHRHMFHTKAQPKWVPRSGETVLFFRNMKPGEALRYDNFDRKDNLFKFWEEKSRSWTGRPQWEAGIMAIHQGEKPNLRDLIYQAQDATEGGNQGASQSSTSTFDVLPMPALQDLNKSLIEEHIFLSLDQIRPFSYYLEFLGGTLKNLYKPHPFVPGCIAPSSAYSVEDATNVHPTINNALIASASCSLLWKRYMQKIGDVTVFSCAGVRLGAELLIPGDVIRILPFPRDPAVGEQDPVTEVMKVENIRLQVVDNGSGGLAPSRGPYDSTFQPFYTAVHLLGQIFTTDISKAYHRNGAPTGPEQVVDGMKGYGHQWFRTHEEGDQQEVKFSAVGGRVHEAEAMSLWFSNQFDLGLGCRGTTEARYLSILTDPRLSIEQNKDFFPDL